MYGELVPSLMGQGINVLLAEADWRRTSAPPATRQLCRPLGDVAGLPIGSRWKNGASASVDDQIETVVIDVPALDGWPKHQLGEAFFTPGGRGVYPLMGLKDAPVWRIETGSHSYFVPAVELIRATFGSTTEFLRLTIEGGLQIWPTKRRMIFDLKASGPDPSDPGVIRIKAHRSLYRREAETIARILTNERMRKAFMQVFASVQRAELGGKPKYPTTLFPFDQPTQWTVDTVWTCVNREGGWRRLVTRIRSIKTPPLAFRKVVVELADGRGELEPGEKRRPVAVKSSDTVQERIKMHPHRPPVSNLTTTALNGGHSSREPGFELEHIVVDATGRQSTVAVHDEDDKHVEMGSTWWSHGKGGGAVGISFQSSVVDFPDEPREADAILQSTRNALELLARKRGWQCEVVSPHFGSGADPRDGLFRYPPEICGRPLTWSIVQRGRESGGLRRALVMHLITPEGNIYAIDAERQGTTEGHALGLIFTPSRAQLTYEVIEDILAVNAGCRGVWGDLTLAHPTVKLKRNATWFTDVSAYSTGMVRPIFELLSGMTPNAGSD